MGVNIKLGSGEVNYGYVKRRAGIVAETVVGGGSGVGSAGR